MRFAPRAGLAAGVLVSFGLASWFSFKFGTGGLWRGLEPALAVTAKQAARAPYDLTRLEAVNETLKLIRDKYVDPARVKPRDMLLAALNRVQQDVAQVIVLHDDNAPEVLVRVETAERRFRVDNIQGPWDIAARLREVFAFLQEGLKGTEVDLRDVEYAACNGMLHTLDPHSVFLSPDAYKEMNMSTTGAFGGLGIVISVRDQMLTVMNPMPGTPAGKAGIKRLDRITKINNESTLNMPLDDAVRRLRGEPGTKVTVWIHRDGADGWQGSKPFELSRERIQVKSVESRLLEGGVGYIRLKQFQSASAKEVEAALNDFKAKDPNVKGLVLDLRGNPGGLLDQAVKIADLFVKRGTIVATVGASEGREEKQAKDGGEPTYPVVVLVNGSSASASEIVAGALKNLDRAVIVGSTTFGKGSVQLVFSDVTSEKAALKLTIAQYLTPGDESIQSVGISPDIELDPMTVDPLEMDLFSANSKVLRERDLSAHLSNARAREGQKPSETVRYYLPEQERAAIRDRGGDLDDNFEADFPIRFGRELALRMPSGQKRMDQVHAAHEFIAQIQKEEISKVSTELEKATIAWAEAPANAPGPTAKDFEVTVTTDRPSNEVAAGQPMTLKVTVKNNGKDPVYRLRAVTTSDSGYYEGKELVFGKIMPGQSRTATAPLGWCEVEGKKLGSSAPTPANAPRVCRLPKDAITRQDGVKIRFEADGDHVPVEAEFRPTVRALERPLFSYAYEIIDNRNNANGDGRFQRGEGATMYLTVKNVGTGRSSETQANLRNLSGDGILLNEGRFTLNDMAPGETRRVAFTFDVQPALEENEFKVELSVGDRDLREVASEKIKVAVEPAAKVEPMSGAVKPTGNDGAMLFESPSAAARAFGKLPGSGALRAVGRIGEFVKVELPRGRFAFVARKDVADGGTPSGGDTPFEDLLLRSPPQVEFKAASLATREPRIKVSGVASDVDRILDGYMFVNSRKVFYRSNRNSNDPKKLTFEHDVALRPGVNIIRFFARENPDTITQRVVVVRRDGPGGELLTTPKGEEALFEEAGGE